MCGKCLQKICVWVKHLGKPNKLCIDQGKEVYNNLMQKWLDENDILMYSNHNEGK